MMPKNSLSLSRLTHALMICCALLLCSGVATAQQARVYSTSPNGSELTLYVPSIKVGDHSFGNVWFDLTDANTLVIDRFTRLDAEERDILARLESAACSPAGNLEKVAAYQAYLEPDATYCLRANKGSTIEGGTFFTYLLIEDQHVQHVEDVRLDGFAQCCFGGPDGPGILLLGYYENDVFVEADLSDTLDMTKDYVLRVPDASGHNYEF